MKETKKDARSNRMFPWTAVALSWQQVDSMNLDDVLMSLRYPHLSRLQRKIYVTYLVRMRRDMFSWSVSV